MVQFIRYPKVLNRTMAATAANELDLDGPNVVGGFNYLHADDDRGIWACPARYSAIRKVVFWAVIESGSALTGNVRLRIGPANQTDTARDLRIVTIADNSVVNPPPSARVTPWGGGAGSTGPTRPTDPNFDSVAYAKIGSAVPFFQTTGAEDRILVQVEFDVFEAASQDFFTDWFAVSGEDDFIYFTPTFRFEDLSGAAAGLFGNVEMHGFGMTVVQAPAAVNNSCSYIDAGQVVQGRVTVTTGARAYQVAARTGKSFWQYDEQDWDGIDSIHVFAFWSHGNNNQSVLFKVIDVTDAPLATDIIEIDQDFGAAQPNVMTFRSVDIKALLATGRAYTIDFATDAAGSAGPWNFPLLYFEVIQKDFSVTATQHVASTHMITPADTVAYSDGSGIALFDPLWYQALSEDQLLRRLVQLSVFNANGANNERCELRIDANLQSQDTTHGSATGVGVTPNINLVAAGAGQVNRRYTPITANDPIDLAGQRKMARSAPAGAFWSAGAPTSELGIAALVYVFQPGNSEIPDLGPVFDLGAFNPEGCASTSAGLGDPGLLVITNGSTIPQHFNPIEGIIENNGVPTPFEDEVPTTVVGETAASPAGGLVPGLYVYRYTFRNCCTGKESDPNPDDIEVDTTGVLSPRATVTLSFAGIRIPADPQICEICIYRTVVGGAFPVMAKVGCFDPDVASTFVDTLVDDELDFINEGLSLLNAPMPCVPVVAEFRNRLFGMGDIPQLSPAGTVSVVNGSDLVVGDADVDWDRCLVGKYLHIEGDCRSYEILRILPPEAGTSPPIGRLRLVDDYEGANGTALAYTICGRPNRLYFSEPLEPECWPAINFLDVEPGDGDRLMGAVSNFNRLIICKRRKTYVLTFREQPLTEVVVPTRISSDIGCMGPRSFAQIESGSAWLSERGVVLYDGRAVQHVPQSEAMNDIFIDPDNDRYIRRDSNGRVIEAVGVFYPKREQYLLILPTKRTVRGCDLMLVWDVKLGNVTLLEFCQEFLAMVVAKDSSGNERVYLGDTNGFVWIYDIGDTDGVGVPNATGTVRGTVSAAGVTLGASFLDDEDATFIVGGLPELGALSGVAGFTPSFDGDELGLAGVCVYVRASDAAPDAPWVQRTVFAATETRLYVTPSWGNDTPGVGYDYMIGPIDFNATFKPNNYGTDDDLKRHWSHVLVHEPQDRSAVLRVEILPDFANSDLDELADDNLSEGRLFDLNFPRGRQQAKIGRVVYNFEQIRMTNFAPDEPISVINHLIRATPRLGK